jgi:hypothetical protein
MAQRRINRGWHLVGDEDRDPARGGNFTAAGEYLPALRLRPGDRSMEAKCARRRHRRTLRGRCRHWFPAHGFQHEREAKKFLEDLGEQLGEHGLELNEEQDPADPVRALRPTESG